MSAQGARRYCGREFSAVELDHIRELLELKPVLGRVALSRRICQDLGWLNVLGQPKEMSCRVALLRMEKDGLIGLPPPLRKKGRRQRRFELSAASDPREPVQASIQALEPLIFARVEKGLSSLWNEPNPEVSLLGLPASERGPNALPGLERRPPASGRSGVRGLRLASPSARSAHRMESPATSSWPAPDRQQREVLDFTLGQVLRPGLADLMRHSHTTPGRLALALRL